MRIFLLFFIISISLKSQTKNHHIIGLNVDYSTLPGIVGTHIGTNFTYIYAYKKLFTRLELGVIPKSNFGPIIKTCLNIGFTSDINQPISFHACAGIGGLTPTEKYIYYNDEYDFYAGPINADIGTLIRPTNNDKLSIGIDLMTCKYEIFPTGWVDMSQYNAKSKNGFVFFLNCSINYKLNGKSSAKS